MDENVRNKENNVKNKTTVGDKKVVVPVAQFEAFKVYEDEEQQQLQQQEQQVAELPQPQAPQPQPRQPKHVANNPYSIYKDQIGNRFITKTELAEIERNPTCENAEPQEEIVASGGGSSKDHFFDVEDYRTVIYQYLRQHEVSFCCRWRKKKRCFCACLLFFFCFTNKIFNIVILLLACEPSKAGIHAKTTRYNRRHA